MDYRNNLILKDKNKTDPLREGQSCAIPFGNEGRCPVRAIIEWREASKVWSGKVFRQLTKSHDIVEAGISSSHWNRRLKEIAKEAKLPNAAKISSHSLRRGSTTEAARHGASVQALQKHGRWRSMKTVLEYIDEGRQFADSAINTLYDFGK